MRIRTKNRKQKVIITISAIMVIGIVLAGSNYGFKKYRTNNPKIIKPFPNPLALNNGSLVETAEDWDLRRVEIKETMADLEYGHMPGRPDVLRAALDGSEVYEGGGTLDTFTLSIVPDNSTPAQVINMSMWALTPEGTGPFPAIVLVASYGSGMDPIARSILDRGYMLVFYDREMLDPDTQGTDIVGPCQTAYPSYDWGSLAVWAWGAMRVVDFLVGESWVDAPGGIPNTDAENLIVTGHSRSGKTALIAGAYDERFALVVPNGSGCGGAGSFLVQGYICETVRAITSERMWKSWLQQDFNQFAGKEENLPFDQHFMRALVAPRLILSTDGLSDYWANPVGTQAVYEAAQPVFDVLNVSTHSAIHYREGGHDQNAEDFAVLLNFADRMLLNKSVVDDFYMQPFDLDLTLDY